MRSLPYTLDDWVDGEPDAWDYMAVLRDNDAFVSFSTGDGWSLFWEHGSMSIGLVKHDLAHKAAALFIELWLRGVSASFANKMMDGYILRESTLKPSY